MQQQHDVLRQASTGVLETNKVLRNTYILLSLTLLFSALTAGAAVMSNAAPLNPFVTLIGYFGLLFAVQATANSGLGLVFVFAFTGFFGYTLGPIINMYLHAFVNGPQLVMTSLGATGVIFFALSGYAMSTQKDFSYMAGFLLVGLLAIIICSVANMFFQIPAFDLAISFAVVMIFSGFILFDTSQIIHGGQRNYVLATIQLYISIINIFLSLLQILGALAGDRD
jgi:modulator of FtsH protease